jgi:hypothetical protein
MVAHEVMTGPRALRLGLDIDDTITADPAGFARIAERVLAGSGEVHVVTSRSAQGRKETIAELADYGLRYDKLYFLPPMSMANLVCPLPQLDWYSKFLWCKLDYAQARGLECFVDDDDRVGRLFRELAPEIRFLTPVQALAYEDW